MSIPIMLTQFGLGAMSVTAEEIASSYVGSVTDNWADIDIGYLSIDISGISIQANDVLLLSVSHDGNIERDFTVDSTTNGDVDLKMYHRPSDSNPGFLVWYAKLDGTESTIYIDDLTLNRWSGGTAIATVYRGVDIPRAATFTDWSTTQVGSSSSIVPPRLEVQDKSISVAIAALDDDAVDLTSSDLTMIVKSQGTGLDITGTSAAHGYDINTSGTTKDINYSSFGSTPFSYSDNWEAITIELPHYASTIDKPPQHIGHKNYTFSDTSGFINNTTVDLSGISIQSGDYCIITVGADNAADTGTTTWGGDVDFTVLKEYTSTAHMYVGYAVLDGTESDIIPTDWRSNTANDCHVHIDVFRDVQSISDVVVKETNTASSISDTIINNDRNDIVYGSVLARNTFAYHIANTPFIPTATIEGTDVSTVTGYSVVPVDGNVLRYKNDSNGATPSLRTYVTMSKEPPAANANITLVGTASVRASSGAGIVDISGIDIQAGDLIYVAHTSESDTDGAYTWKTSSDGTLRNMSNNVTAGGTSTMPHTSAYRIATGDETSVYASGTSTNWDNSCTVVAVFRSTTLSFTKGDTTTVESGAGVDCVFDYDNEFILPGKLIIAEIHSDSGHGTTDDPITAPSGWTLAVSKQHDDDFAKTAIAYRVDYGTGNFNGNTFGDSTGTSRYWSAYTTQWT